MPAARILRPVVVALALAAVTALVACDDGPRTVEVSADEAGTTVELTLGDELVDRLGSNITTGYRWELTAEPEASVLELVGSDYVAPETELVGAGGEEVWRFRARDPGATAFTLEYVGPSGERGAGTFDLEVRVRG